MSEAVQPQFDIQKIYLKDVSLETPNSPFVFTQPWQPEVSLELGTQTSEVAEGLYEVTLRLTATAKLEDKVAFLVEIQQAGLFVLRNFPEDQHGAMLGAYCPNLLFPYAREAVDNLVSKGGFPPLMLRPVNFDALYMQRLQQQAEQQG